MYIKPIYRDVKHLWELQRYIWEVKRWFSRAAKWRSSLFSRGYLYWTYFNRPYQMQSITTARKNDCGLHVSATRMLLPVVTYANYVTTKSRARSRAIPLLYYIYGTFVGVYLASEFFSSFYSAYSRVIYVVARVRRNLRRKLLKRTIERERDTFRGYAYIRGCITRDVSIIFK